MAKIKIGNTSFEFHAKGKGEPLLLVHGSASDYRTWHYQQDEFAKNYQAISYSRRYHWPNNPIPDGADYSMAIQVDDLSQLIHTIDAGPVHLVGHSYGAFLCLLLALREPQLVRTLVLPEPPVITLFVSSTPKPLEILKLWLTRPATALAIIKFGAKGIQPGKKAFQAGDVEGGIEKFADAVFGPGAYENFSPANRATIHDNRLNVRAELMGSGFLPVDPERVKQLQIPTLLVTGEKSIPLFHYIIDRLEELIPDTTRVEIPGATHAMHVDNPSAFNQAITSFLMKH